MPCGLTVGDRRARPCDEDDDFYQGIVATLDDHLDRADHELDAAAAAAQAAADAAAGVTTAAAAPVIPPPAKRGRVPFHVGTLARPQDSFDAAVDNADVDWMPPPPLGSSHQYQAAAGVHPLVGTSIRCLTRQHPPRYKPTLSS